MTKGLPDSKPAQSPLPATARGIAPSFFSRLASKIDLRVVLLALAITIAQIILATLLGRGNSWFARYMSLWIFDGGPRNQTRDGFRNDLSFLSWI